MEKLNLAINFISEHAGDQPELSPASQTGDFITPLIVALVVLFVAGGLFFTWKYLKSRNVLDGSAIVKVNSKMLAVAIALIVSVGVVCCFAASKAFANSGDIYMPSAINAVVYDDGHVEFDNAVLKSNDVDKVVEYRSVTARLADGVSQMDGVTWSVSINDEEIYNKEIPGWEGKRFYFENENVVSIKADGLTLELAQSLIGKNAVSFEFGLIATEPPADMMSITIKSDSYGKVKNGISGEPQTEPFVFTYPFLDDVYYSIDQDTGAVVVYHGKDPIISIFNTINDADNYYHLGWFVGEQKLESTKYVLDGDITLEAQHDKYVLLTFQSDANGQIQVGSNPPTSEPVVYKFPKNFLFTVYDMGTYTYITCGGTVISNVNNEGFVFDKWVDLRGKLAGTPEGVTYTIGSHDYTITSIHKAVEPGMDA